MSSSGVFIIGLGPAGATLAYEASRRGISVWGYDVSRRYVKACGNATPRGVASHYLAEYLDSVVADVDTFHILVNGAVSTTVASPKPLWVVIDKESFVNGLRELAASEGARIIYGKPPRPPRGSVVVDARGPFSNNRRGILVYRVIARARWPDNEAMIDFNVELGGLTWIFPMGHNTVNAGAGFTVDVGGVRALSAAVRGLLSRIDKDYAVIDERAAPLSLLDGGVLYDSRAVYIGEAAGLVNALSGEGIRQAVLSALRLAEALDACGQHLECSRKRYRTYVRSLQLEAALSRILLKLVLSGEPSRAASLIRSLGEGFWLRFLQGRLLKALAATAGRPRSVAGLLRLVLGRLAGPARSQRSSRA